VGNINIITYYRNFCNRLTPLYSENEAKRIAQILLQRVTGKLIFHLLANNSNTLSAIQLSEAEEYLSQLKLQKPIQYIIGETDFFGINLRITPDVLIPRPETEELVDWVIKSNVFPKPSILDIGTGSGCIAIALAKNIASSRVTALDISPKAIALAKQNAAVVGVEVDFFVFDILGNSPWPSGNQVDIIVSNPPYVRESEKKLMGKNVLDFEPHMALFVNDGQPLIFYDAIARYADSLLKTRGAVFCEVNEAFGRETADLFTMNGFTDVQVKRDINGKERMVKAVKK